MPPIQRPAYRELGDTELIDLMRQGDERAIDEFLIRTQRLLYDRVRYWRLALSEVENCVSDLLEDIAVQIVDGRIRPTRSVAAYVVKAFRVRLAQRSRMERERREIEDEASQEAAGVGERAVTGMVSEATVRASHGVEWEPLPVPLAVRRLATMLHEGLTKDERRILSWLSNFVAQRDISAWLGITYAAGTQRIWRLRDRLRATAEEYARHFSRHEQTELARFFDRLREPTVLRAAARKSSSNKTTGPDADGEGGVA